jgi:hypothetical protein
MSPKKDRKSGAEKRPVRAAARGGRPKSEGKAGRVKKAKRALSPLEVQLRRTLAEMGLARARRVFAAVEASFDN